MGWQDQRPAVAGGRPAARRPGEGKRAVTNLAQIMRDAQADHGGRRAVRQGSLTMTYGELAAACGRAVAPAPQDQS